MKDKVNQLFKDKLFLVMMVIGLLTAVAAVGVLTVGSTDENGQSPYMEVPGGQLMAQESSPEENTGDNGQAEEKDAQDDPKAFVQKNTDENAGNNVQTDRKDTAENKNAGNDLAAEAGAGKQAAKALVLNFTDTSVLTWPVRGNVILDYSMDQTVYFPTLDQFKCNPGIVIQAEVSDPVAAPANAKVLEVGSNEEIGNFVVLDLGNEYTATCGQLKEISAVPGEYLEAGQILGYVAEPTKYYSVEGVNVFFELKHQEKAVDPLDQME